LQLDSARTISWDEFNYFAVLDSTNKIVAKISKDSLKKQLAPPTESPQMFSSGYYTCTQSYFPEPFSSIYTDSNNIANMNQGYICIQLPNQSCQIRKLTDDWPTSGSFSFTQSGYSIVFIGNYIYVLCFQFNSSTFDNFTPRVYRYLKNNLAAGGTLITVTGLPLIATTGTFIMSSNGVNFFFSYNGGNSINSNVIAKYSLSGTTLSYISSLTCGITTDFRQSFIVDTNGDLFSYTNIPVEKIRHFSPSGIFVSERTSTVNYLLNWNDIFYGTRNTSISPVPFLFYEKINR
jgi:hypothetical protein